MLIHLVPPNMAPVLRWLCSQAGRHGFSVFPEDDARRLANPDKTICRIDWVSKIIYVRQDRTQGPDVVWDLIHEFGHVLQELEVGGGRVRTPAVIKSFLGQQTKGEKLAWEHNAWVQGWNAAVTEHPFLAASHREFWIHANGCIASYCQ